MTKRDGAWSIDGKHVAARRPKVQRVDIAARDEEQAEVRADGKVVKRPCKLALAVRGAAGGIVFRNDLIAGVHRHDASARDGPADRGAGLCRGGRSSS